MLDVCAAYGGFEMPNLGATDITVLYPVHDFFLKVLEQELNHVIPLPVGLHRAPSTTPDFKTISILQQWLNLLDLSTTPPMFRDELEHSGESTAAALLNYYAHKTDHVATDRDKTDFVVTWVYRHSMASGAWKAPGAFEKRVTEIVGAPATPLPEEYRQLLREFEFLCTEVEDTEHFDKLMDSSMVQRVRDIKASFGKSFYHPKVLATVAAYNVDFGKKFDELFKQATKEIKEFAERVHQEGGSVATRVEGDVTVKQLEDIEDHKILKTDYREAQEQFRKVSKLKKAVDSKRKRATAGSAESAYAMGAKAAARAERIGQVSDEDRLAIIVPSESDMAARIEEGKLLTIVESIRNFVKAADPARAQVIPLRHGTITLANHEVETFRVDYLLEKSFRADFANTLLKVVGCSARIEAELVDFSNMKKSAYLWKPHADSLTNLVKLSQALTAEAMPLNATAIQRGLSKKVEAMNQSLEKMQQKVKLATATLSQLTSK